MRIMPCIFTSLQQLGQDRYVRCVGIHDPAYPAAHREGLENVLNGQLSMNLLIEDKI